MYKKYLIGVGAVILTALFVYMYGQYQYGVGKKDAETAQYLADLEQFKNQVKQLQSVSAHISLLSTRLQSISDDIIKEYNNEVIQNPLSTDCIMSNGRVRLINDIIKESTTTRQSSAGVPRNPIIKQ